MAESASPVGDIIRRYCEELARVGIRVTQVFLFGSHAKGTAHEWSDVDLIVVSPDFAPLGLLQRLELLGEAAGEVFEPVQAYGVTPEEVEGGDLAPFWEHILAHEAVPVAV